MVESSNSIHRSDSVALQRRDTAFLTLLSPSISTIEKVKEENAMIFNLLLQKEALIKQKQALVNQINGSESELTNLTNSSKNVIDTLFANYNAFYKDTQSLSTVLLESAPFEQAISLLSSLARFIYFFIYFLIPNICLLCLLFIIFLKHN